MKHRILFQSNPTHIKTGLSENAKTLLKYLYGTGRYEVAHLCTQGTMVNDPRLGLTPWKSFGAIPADQALINQINGDPQLRQNAAYGSFNIDNVIKEWKPTIWIGSDDLWAFPLSDYCEKPWYKAINSVHHITIDSIPVLDQAFEQAKRSKYYVTWAKFAVAEMRKARPDGSMNHVTSIYGAMDTKLFSPIADTQKAELRKQFGLDPDALIFLFVSRNQLRKSFPRVIEAFARFKREYPNVKAHLHFHTSFSEKGAGWDIPKQAAFYGVDPKDILSTYSCRSCGRWWVAPYCGEDKPCPHCGDPKSAISANIQHGVPALEMRYVYGLSDACISAFTSGGQEYHSVQSLLCGRPLSCTNYSCGEDFCTEETKDFIYPLTHHVYDEMGTNFRKATTDVGSITSFMRKVAKSSKRDLQEVAEKGRAWAARTFSIETIGAQWEKLFASMPATDWTTITLTEVKAKNEGYPMPGAEVSDETFVQSLYTNVLLMDEKPDGEGMSHWLSKLKAGLKRDDVYRYFIQVAQQENAKNRPPQDLSSMLDNTGRKRGLFVIKESIGDVALCTALFKSFHEEYPDTDLYVGTDPKYHEVLAGNEHVHKVLPHIAAFEAELAMIGQGAGPRYFDYYFNAGILTQSKLGYLGRGEPGFEVDCAPRAMEASS